MADESTLFSHITRDLAALRETVRVLLDAYRARLESDIEKVEQRVSFSAAHGKPSSSMMRDIRDMTTILRQFEVKTDKGRRKDFKKLETLIEDLEMLTEGWSKKR